MPLPSRITKSSGATKSVLILAMLFKPEIHSPPAPRSCLSALALAIVLAGAGCASLPGAGPHSDCPAQWAQIEQRLQEIFAAAVAKDFDRLDSYHLYGPNFTKFSGSSPQRQDATAARNGEHAGLGAINGLKMAAEGLKIDLFGDVAIATFILDYSFASGGETVHAKERTTMVFVKDGGAWRIAHEHLSAIKP
jgi:ketosteroid isomerase-like protein